MQERAHHVSPESRRIRQLARCICFIENPQRKPGVSTIPVPVIEEARRLLRISASAGRERELLLQKMHIERAAILADIEGLEAGLSVT